MDATFARNITDLAAHVRTTAIHVRVKMDDGAVLNSIVQVSSKFYGVPRAAYKFNRLLQKEKKCLGRVPGSLSEY